MDWQGSTALHWAAGFNDSKNSEAIVDLLLDAGADIGARNSFSKTPYDLAVDRNKMKIAARLHEKQLALVEDWETETGTETGSTSLRFSRIKAGDARCTSNFSVGEGDTG